MSEPATVGCYRDENDTPRCRGTGKACLSHRQAVQRARDMHRRARRRNEPPVEAFHCTSCDAWHVGHNTRLALKPKPRRRKPRTPRRREW